jgi:hypothetical protein
MARGLQKAQAQAKNAGLQTKSADERAADRKAKEANSTAIVCMLCRQTFASETSGIQSLEPEPTQA